VRRHLRDFDMGAMSNQMLGDIVARRSPIPGCLVKVHRVGELGARAQLGGG
jgi:hypothetical protein